MPRTKKTHKKTKKGKKSNRKPRVTLPKDTSIVVLNKIREKPFRSLRSQEFRVYSYAASSGVVSANILFDPSGVYGTNASMGNLMKDWTGLTNIFDKYKVHKIKVTFTMSDSDDLGSNAVLYCRYNYDPGFATPSFSNMSDLTRVVQKSFTNDHPVFQYTIRPKVNTLTQNAGALAAQGQQMKSMGWCDVDFPVALYGLSYYFTGTQSTQTFYIDIEYDISFKYNT